MKGGDGNPVNSAANMGSQYTRKVNMTYFYLHRYPDCNGCRKHMNKLDSQ